MRTKDKRGKFIPRDDYTFSGTVEKCGSVVKYLGRTIIVKPDDKKERYFIIHNSPIPIPVNSKVRGECSPNGIFRYRKESNWTIEFRNIWCLTIDEGK